MDRLGSWLSTGDQVASVIGAVAAVLALVFSVRRGGVSASDRDRTRSGRSLLVAAMLLAVAASAIGFVPEIPSTVATTVRWSLAAAAAGTFSFALWRRRARHTVSAVIVRLAAAQIEDEARHRYRFFEHNPPALVDVYVRPRLQAGAGEPAQPARALKIDEVLSAASPGHALLVGGAGAGKSALVTMVVADSARAIVAGRPRDAYAVSVRASDLVDRQLVEALARASQRDLRVVVDAATFADAPVPGKRWRIMVDGLDEIVDATARGVLLGRLRTWLNARSSPYQFVVTTRALASDDMLLLRQAAIREYELRPFDRDDLSRFAERWFGARYPDDQPAARSHAARFLARVAGARLGAVARVPLLASIAAMVYERVDAGVLPTSRAELYERFVAHLLDGRRELSEIREAIRPALVARGHAGVRLAEWLATDFYEIVDDLLDTAGDAVLRHPDADLAGVACERLAACEQGDLPAALPDGRRWVRDLLFATGVFTMDGHRLLFAHQSFAEFFASRQRATDFDVQTWRRQMADPALRSLAAFAVTRRSDANLLIAGLLDGPDADPVAAGALLAHGVPVASATRTAVLDAMLGTLRQERPEAPECLAILRDLSIEPDVLERLSDLAGDRAVSAWIRATVADAIADVDPAAGIALLRSVAADADKTTDDAVRRWVLDALDSHGAGIGPVEWAARRGGDREDSSGPIGSLARHMLTQQALDGDRREADRIAAAIRLADGGDLTPLRALVTAPEVHYLGRLRAASVIADHEDIEPLQEMSRHGTIATRYGAAVELHRRDARAANELLRSMVREGREYPLSYGAAARLAESDDPQPLIDLALSTAEPTAVAVAAVRTLAGTQNSDVLYELAAKAPHPRARAWAYIGLLQRGHTDIHEAVHDLLKDRRIGSSTRFELTCLLAAGGDRRAHHRLHRPAPFTRSWRRLARARALAEIGDPAGLTAIRRFARGRLHRASLRVRAAAEIARLDPSAGTTMLGELATTGQRSRVRLGAATELAYHHNDLKALIDLVLDDAAPTRHRVEALEFVRKAGKHHITLVQTERIISTTAMSRLFGNDIDADYQPLPASAAYRIARLAHQTSTPARLRIAAALTALPHQPAADVLAAIASAHEAGIFHRATAAARLTQLEPSRGLAAQRTIVRDRHHPRALRWLMLFSSNLPELEDFSTQRGHRDALLDLGWRALPQLVRLAFTEPDPAPWNSPDEN